MKKDNIHDYAIAAFRYYAQQGRPKDIKEDYSACTKDLKAVHNTLTYLETAGDIDTIKALDLVYFAIPNGKIKKGLITNLVISASIVMNRDKSAVWAMLAKAKQIFAEERGLRHSTIA